MLNSLHFALTERILQALDAAPDDAEAHGTYLAALNRHKKPAEVLRVADAHRPASNPAVVVEVRSQLARLKAWD